MRNALSVLLSVLVCGSMASESGAVEQGPYMSPAPQGGLQIEIQSPSADFAATEGETTVEVEGIASAIGGVRYLDMIFVMDTSQSLRSTDPTDFRSAGAIGLVRNGLQGLSAWSGTSRRKAISRSVSSASIAGGRSFSP